MKDNGKMNKKATKAQSAMEYLMTYGWAILIIAVVLAALDLLGVFNGSAFVGTACLATPGYTCSNPVLATGTPNPLNFTFTQSTGVTLYNVSFACAASANSSGLPAEGSVTTPFASSNFITTSNTLATGSSVTITGLDCYNANGALMTGNPIGTAFGGTIYMSYSTSSSNSPILVAPVAKVTVKVS